MFWCSNTGHYYHNKLYRSLVMDHSKLSDYLFLIKHLVNSQETLFEYQSKVESMVQLVLERDLIDYPALKLHVFINELSDSVERAIYVTDDIMSALNGITNFLRI